MIRLRLSSIGSNKDFEIPINNGESVLSAVNRLFSKVDRVPIEKFRVLVNGVEVPFGSWGHSRIYTQDLMFVFPKIESDEAKRIVATVAFIAITAGTGSFLSGKFGTTFAGQIGTAIGTTAVALATSAIISQLLPPVDQKDADTIADAEKSQIYTVTRQSNSPQKYGRVPKVYGTHRIFPNVAANPYVELEPDPEGNLAQYFYGLYDIGYGPNLITDIRIGDTPIGSFEDAYYQLVDFNRDDSETGSWTDGLGNALQFYKGDVEFDSVGLSLTGDKSEGDPQSEWRITRTLSDVPAPYPQEISLVFSCPRGLFGQKSTGALEARTIKFDISFQKDGDAGWYPFSDTTVVNSFSMQGAVSENLKTVSLNPGGVGFSAGVTFEPPQQILSSTVYSRFRGSGFGGTRTTTHTVTVGYPIGVTQLLIDTNVVPSKIVGSYIYVNGKIVGFVNTLVGDEIFDEFLTINLLNPTEVVIPAYQLVYTVVETFSLGILTSTTTNLVSFTRASTWESKLSGNLSVTKSSRDPFFFGVKFTPKEIGQLRVKIERLTTTPFDFQYNFNQTDVTLLSVQSRYDQSPVSTSERHTFLEVKIKATNQLSGTVDNLSVTASSVLEAWNGSAWVKQITNNPAWIFADVLTGAINKRAISKSRLDTTSLLQWANYCDEIPSAHPSLTYERKRFECNFILDYETTVLELINLVTNSAKASINLIDGKYGVLLDVAKTVPVQVFTPRNYKSFSSQRQYGDTPHAIKSRYIDPVSSWEISEATVYDDGFDENTATNIEEITCFGVTNFEQAWRYARYLLFQHRLRQEVITIETDFEYLVCTRGDYVKITQDSMKAGGTPARVRSVSGNRITIDDAIEVLPISYGFVFRSTSTGAVYSSTLTVVDSETFDLDGVNIPVVGDLIIIGEVGLITYDCLVKTITPGDDLSATLTLVDLANGVHDSDTSGSLPSFSAGLSNTVDPVAVPPNEVENLAVIDNDWTSDGASYTYYIEIDWDPPTGSVLELYNVYLNTGSGYDLITQTKKTDYTYIVDQDFLDVPHSFKVVAVSVTGLKLDLAQVGEVSATPFEKTERPSDVAAMDIDITGEVLQLVWERVTDSDLDEYLIRYSPLVTGATWETSVPLIRADRNSNLYATQARTGTYLIKAVDLRGTESEIATLAITSIPNLSGLNIIEVINDFPTLNGARDLVTLDGAALRLKKSVIGDAVTTEYFSEGYYYFENLLDLGTIATTRLEAKVLAEGFTLEDIMENWVTLDSVEALSGSKFSEWDAQLQYRGASQYNVMSQWATLDSITTLREGADDLWTDWRTFIKGDATARILQFRLKLLSTKPSVTPRVYDAEIRADMPDRVERYDNVSAGSGGHTINYSPGFMGPGTSPSVQISINSASTGDYWSFTSKTLDGFTIQFFDKDSIAVARDFDAVIAGYGRKAVAVI